MLQKRKLNVVAILTLAVIAGLAVLMAVPVTAVAGTLQLNEGAGIGARALAMGGAFVAVADDASGGFWNPAGLEGLDKRWASYSGLINNRDQKPGVDDFIVYAEPDNGFASGAVSALRESHKDPVSGLTTSKSLYSYSLALKAPATGLSFGGSLKYITESQETTPGQLTSGTAFSVDVGGMLRLTPGFAFGVMAQDLVRPTVRFSDPAAQPRSYPLVVNAGAAWRPDDKTVFAVDAHDLTKAGPVGMTVHVGVERWLTPIIALRAGAQAGIAGAGWQGITAGTALRYTDWQLDYAFLARDLGDTSVMTLSYRF